MDKGRSETMFDTLGTESQPSPLDDIMIDFLLDQRNEMPWLDFKYEIHVGKESDFPEIAKDIFAIGNYGGGYLVVGVQEKPTGSFDYVGLPLDFHIDNAVIQEKFNSYSSRQIQLYYTEARRVVDGEERKFPVLYVAPFNNVVVPIKDGIYKKKGREHFAFRKGDVFIRRGSQSIRASTEEIEWIAKRADSEAARPAVLSGDPDMNNEVIFGNLLRVMKLPPTVYVAKALPKRQTMNTTSRYPGPHVVVDGQFYSFLNLGRPGFKDRLISDTVTRIKTESLMEHDSDLDILIRLLNSEIRSAGHSIGLRYQKQGARMFFPIRKRGDVTRKETWAGRYKKSTRTVAKRFFHKGLKRELYHHAAVRFRFTAVNDTIYLKLIPRIVLTEDGIDPFVDPTAGTKITSLSYNVYNTQYLLNILFWISLLPHNQNGLININGRILLSNELVQSSLPVGIRGDLPVREQAAEFEEHQVDVEKPRKSDFDSYYLGEPNLVFGYGQVEKDPRTGLKHFGPYDLPDGTPALTQVRVGIVGTGNSVTVAKKILELLASNVASVKPNRWLFPSYPGFRRGNSIDCEFVISPNWVSNISQMKIDRIIKIVDVNERIAKAAELFTDHTSRILAEDNPPTVVICCLPEDIEEFCGISWRTRGAKRPKLTEEEKQIQRMAVEGQTFLTEWGIGIDDEFEETPRSFDLWAAMKGRAMDLGVPIQIVLESRAKSVLNYSDSTAETEPPSSYAWNLSTGLYYKASGRPWRLAKLTQGTCYVGISFYKSRLDPEDRVRTAMAQVFTHSGEGFVLRGGEVSVQEWTREANMTKVQASNLMSKVISEFIRHTNAPPSRFVIHKTSKFSDDERHGFSEAIGEIPTDFVAIRQKQGYRFLRSGNYPVLRGTTISLTQNLHLLYTNGYSPRLRSYPGHHVPDPLLIEHIGDSEFAAVSKEILGLTKLDWNTTAFNKKLPITLAFAKKVGMVLAEFPNDKDIQSHYRFYM